MNTLKLITGAALALALSTPGAYAALGCRDLPTIVTPDNAPVSRVGQGAATGPSGSSASGGSNYSSLLALCQNPDHPWYASRTASGACTRTGSELMTMVGTVSASPTVKYTTYDGDVPDIYSHRNGFVIPPTKWTPEIFIPTTGPLPGSCSS